MGYRGIPEGAAINGDDGKVLHLPTRDPREALEELFAAGVRHLMVEGGSRILSAFLAAGLVDELIVYLAPTLLGSGTSALEDLGITTLADAQRWEWDPASGGAVQQLGRDLRLHLQPAWRTPAGNPAPTNGALTGAAAEAGRHQYFIRTNPAPRQRGHRRRRQLMFTGIIAEQGKVLSVERNGDISATVRLHAPGSTDGLALGGSIAVNGVCLTATEIDGKDFSVDVMGETLTRSTIGELAAGDPVNLERCVPAGGRLDGHVVQGHVDGVGQLLEREALGNWDRLRFGVPAALARYIAEKGSIAVDGVSLTVTAVSPANDQAPWFEVGLIPDHAG